MPSSRRLGARACRTCYAKGRRARPPARLSARGRSGVTPSWSDLPAEPVAGAVDDVQHPAGGGEHATDGLEVVVGAAAVNDVRDAVARLEAAGECIARVPLGPAVGAVAVVVVVAVLRAAV